MSKKKPETELYSYGLYTRWDKKSKDLPQLIKITETVPVEIGSEFGYVIKIKKAKGKVLRYHIDHPAIKDDEGKYMPPFTGEFYINTNSYDFFLGDEVWEPLEEKLGRWILTTWLDDVVIAKKSLLLVAKKEN